MQKQLTNSAIKSLLKKLIKNAMKQAVIKESSPPAKIKESSPPAKDLPTLLKMARQAGKGQTERPPGIRQLPPTEPSLGASAAVANKSLAGGNSSFPQQQATGPRLGAGIVQMFTDGKELWYAMGNWYIRSSDLISTPSAPLTANQAIDKGPGTR